MAKGLGIIGNFKGKVGNIVGYNLKDSNNKQTQGLRAYQPVVRNPKTSRQAEQRAKMAPINATYRALKGIIDRGQEGVAYGNKSRLRFLSEAMKQFDGPWFDKGEAVTLPIKTNITKGSLRGITTTTLNTTGLSTNVHLDDQTMVEVIGGVSTALIQANIGVQNGDQVTFVSMKEGKVDVFSFLVDTSSRIATTRFASDNSNLVFKTTAFGASGADAACVILSREGDNGQHLRSTAALTLSEDAAADTHYTSAAKDAAIESYMAANGNTDWPEESL